MPRRPFGSSDEKFVLHLFPIRWSRLFLCPPLDRFKTPLLLLKAAIPRSVMNLWIAIRMVAIVNTLGKADHTMSSGLSRNMQEHKELRLDPLLLVDRSKWGGCLKNRRIDESASHWQHLSANPGTCSQGYPQKMGNENIYASRFNAMGSSFSLEEASRGFYCRDEQTSWTSTSREGRDSARPISPFPRLGPILPYLSEPDLRTRPVAPKRAPL